MFLGVRDSKEVDVAAIPMELHGHRFEVPCDDSNSSQPWCPQYDINVIANV